MFTAISRHIFLSGCVALFALAMGIKVEGVGLEQRQAGAIRLLRPPAIQQCAADSAVISWKTDLPSSSTVQYGLDESFSLEVDMAAQVTFHAVTLRELRSDRIYHYRIVVKGETLYRSSFRTHPQATDARYHHFSFWGIGDSGTGDSHQHLVRDQIQRLVDDGDADFGIHLGDIVYPEGEESDQDSMYFVPYQNIIDKQVCWPVLGNHDKSTKNGQPYFDNRVLPEPDTLADATNPERWYSFTFGPALFIALDSDNPSNSTQTKFLRLTLERHRDKLWKFVFFHHPPYATAYADTTVCTHASDREARNRWSPLFEEHEVDVVFTAHNHTYQRSQLRRDYFPDKKGVYYIVSGGGGSKVASAGISDSRCNSPALTQAFVKSDTHHLIHVEVSGLALTMRAIDEYGRVFDVFQVRKDTTTGLGGEWQEIVPRSIILRQNYPNPVVMDNLSSRSDNAETAIEFTLSEQQQISLAIYDVLGREVCRLSDEELMDGTHTRFWNGRDRFGNPVSPGIYFYRLTTNDQVVNRRMLVIE